MPVVTKVKAVGPYTLGIWFGDGTRRRVNVEPLPFGEVFEPLRDPEMFRKVSVDAELGTVVWPNGADLSPEFLYKGNPKPVSAAERG
ncbi:MAG: DUF2442 domain-containing protein [Dehalococcoidia bacterium]|nr:DUF2442 domain-containing protein [Dehalococcoidia bacterium]